MTSTVQQNDPRLHRRDPLRNPEIDKPYETFDSENDSACGRAIRMMSELRGGDSQQMTTMQSLEPDVNQVPGEITRSSLG